MTRKELQNLFPPVPGHFLGRIDQTMEEIEAMNKKSVKRIRRVSRPLLIAAIVFVLTAATALAAVLGRHALKDALNASGLEDVAEQVTDIQATDASDGFCLTLDEAVWEGEKLYLSCTVAVPEDGNTYLYGLMMPTLNGEVVAGDVISWFDDSFGPVVCPIGGDYPNDITLILPLEADSSMLADGPALLNLSVAFFTTDREIETMPAADTANHERALMEAYMERFDGPCQQGGYVYKTSDTLYCMGSDPFNPIPLTDYREVASIDWQYDPENCTNGIEEENRIGGGFKPAGSVSGAKPETIAATGLVDYLGSQTLNLSLNESVGSTTLNDVNERRFIWKDVTFTIERFRMTHFTLELVMHAEQESAVNAEFPERLHNAVFALLNGDGSPLAGLYGEAGSFCRIDDDPEGGYTVTITAEALFPDAPGPFMLVPEYIEPTEDNFVFESRVEADDVITTLTPVYSEEVHETELEEQERFEAIRDWKPGDAPQTVYATDQGSYYHCKPDCSGMMNSKAISIEEALAAGKPACPICIGGPNSRVSTEDDYILSN